MKNNKTSPHYTPVNKARRLTIKKRNKIKKTITRLIQKHCRHPRNFTGIYSILDKNDNFMKILERRIIKNSRTYEPKYCPECGLDLKDIKTKWN